MKPSECINKWIVFHPKWPKYMPVHVGICELAKEVCAHGVNTTIKMRVRSQKTGNYLDINQLDTNAIVCKNAVHASIRMIESRYNAWMPPRNKLEEFIYERLNAEVSNGAKRDLE
jgi:hypothetical protein